MNPSGENLIELAGDTSSLGTKIYADSAVSLGQKMAPLLYYQGVWVQQCLLGCRVMRKRGLCVAGNGGR